LLGWLITVAYFAAAALTLIAARRTNEGRERMFWVGCTALLVLLGFNKQLDLQGYITTGGRSLAQHGGWYEQRRLVQGMFLLALCVAAASATTILALWLRRSAAEIRIAAAGIILLFSFVLWRAASFHHMDVWVTRNVAGMRSGWWLETAGIIIIGLSAVLSFRRNRAEGCGSQR
jgi:hypothetical protein